MGKLWDSLVPSWMTLANPAVRLLVGRERFGQPPASWLLGLRWAGILAYFLAVISVLLLGVTPQPTTADDLLLLVILQALASASVFSYTLHAFHRLRRNGTWDMVRTTAGGTRQAMRAAWAATFHRLGWSSFVMLVLPRLLLTGVVLRDLTAFRGEYLAQIVGAAQPSLPWALGVPLVALLLGMSLVLPFTSLSVEAASSLLLSTFTRTGWVAGLLQAVLIALRVGWGVLGGLAGYAVLSQTEAGLSIAQPANALPVLLVSGALGDHAGLLVNTRALDTVFRDVPYSVFIGVGLLGVALAHLLLTEGLLAWAARRAQRF